MDDIVVEDEGVSLPSSARIWFFCTLRDSPSTAVFIVRFRHPDLNVCR